MVYQNDFSSLTHCKTSYLHTKLSKAIITVSNPTNSSNGVIIFDSTLQAVTSLIKCIYEYLKEATILRCNPGFA